MKVIDFLEKSNKTLFCYEIIPRNRGGLIDKIFNLVDKLMPFDTPFIDLTSRSTEVYYEDVEHGLVTSLRIEKEQNPFLIPLKNRVN
ncbi:MAG: hypothetical protein U9N31_04290 [Candidatus Marinimicrobia bacterium]|nr:hypothetical protein [Candidatus Neomarinimicrobiota bacterium]